VKLKEHFDKKYIDDIDGKIGDNYFSPVLDYVFNKIKVTNVCDIGCGNGIFSGSIKQNYQCKVIGVDANSYALSQASKLDFDQLLKTNDFSNDILPVDSGSVDLVICKDVMEHLVDPLHLTQEIFRITKSGGSVLLHVPNHFPIWGRLKFLFTNNIDTFSYFSNTNRYNFPHIRFFTLASVEDMLKKSGFTSIENISFFFTRPPVIHRFIPISLIKKMAKMSTDNFSEGITVLASKAE
jgi:SAM-dependent methyltransferase